MPIWPMKPTTSANSMCFVHCPGHNSRYLRQISRAAFANSGCIQVKMFEGCKSEAAGDSSVRVCSVVRACVGNCQPHRSTCSTVNTRLTAGPDQPHDSRRGREENRGAGCALSAQIPLLSLLTVSISSVLLGVAALRIPHRGSKRLSVPLSLLNCSPLAALGTPSSPRKATTTRMLMQGQTILLTTQLGLGGSTVAPCCGTGREARCSQRSRPGAEAVVPLPLRLTGQAALAAASPLNRTRWASQCCQSNSFINV